MKKTLDLKMVFRITSMSLSDDGMSGTLRGVLTEIADTIDVIGVQVSVGDIEDDVRKKLAKIQLHQELGINDQSSAIYKSGKEDMLYVVTFKNRKVAGIEKVRKGGYYCGAIVNSLAMDGNVDDSDVGDCRLYH